MANQTNKKMENYETSIAPSEAGQARDLILAAPTFRGGKKPPVFRAMVVAQVLTDSGRDSWDVEGTGIVALVRNNAMKTYMLVLVDFDGPVPRVAFTAELYKNMSFHPAGADFLTFSGESRRHAI
eukprot:CAMPEP_0206316798 /NCGR_PEP_ID=MMETSP0106_2-20121207/16289_1 /ASSEMBLY_ACC=CAM_ASM_000206 /TAXON_ID=81532 /ORGANISM="Acanthoeca-like sp., Strain 10tr" /LENGTH=124 /DNA_ID=CAMNT_0053748337 /DNA_START=12 /DNA_END=383 /DNA_ORIENTATION=-